MTRWLRIISPLIVAALVVLLIASIDRAALRAALRDASWAPLLVALALNIPLAALYPVRSWFVLQRMGDAVPLRVLVPSMILGNVAGSLTPMSAGELLRAGALHTYAGTTVEDGLALIAYERAVSLYLLILTTGAAAALAILSMTQAALVALAALVAASLLLAAPAVFGLIERRLPEHPTKSGLLWSLREAASRIVLLLRDRRLLLIWSAITIAMYAIATAQVYFTARSINTGAISFDDSWMAWGASQLAGIASLLPFGLGALDASIAALLSNAGMTLEEGTAVAILTRAVMTLPMALIAGGCYLYLVYGLRPVAENATASGEAAPGDAPPVNAGAHPPV